MLTTQFSLLMQVFSVSIQKRSTLNSASWCKQLMQAMPKEKRSNGNSYLLTSSIYLCFCFLKKFIQGDQKTTMTTYMSKPIHHTIFSVIQIFSQKKKIINVKDFIMTTVILIFFTFTSNYYSYILEYTINITNVLAGLTQQISINLLNKI